MTAYFDDAVNELWKLNSAAPCPQDYDFIRELELRVVHDCTVCSIFEEFPAHLRMKLAEIVLHKGVASQPLNTPPELQADFETFEEHIRRVRSLFGELHDLFHSVGTDRDCPFGDSPLSGVRMFANRGEELRERLAARAAGTTLEAQRAAELEALEGNRCRSCGVRTDYVYCESCAQTQTCLHGVIINEGCPECDIEGDQAFDASRESR